jgi:hypothetical protein
MKMRFYVDPETDLPHIYGHQVDEREVEDVLRHPGEDRPGQEGSRVAVGQSRAGSISVSIKGKGIVRLQATPKEKFMKQSKFPPGWDENRVRRVLAHYEEQSEEEAVAEDEAAMEDKTQTIMEIPTDLVPAVRELIAKRRAS